MWSHILRDQLGISEEEFWACVRDGLKPDRGTPEAPPEALPADVVYLLINRAGLQEAELATMTRAQALARLQRFWTEAQ